MNVKNTGLKQIVRRKLSLTNVRNTRLNNCSIIRYGEKVESYIKESKKRGGVYYLI